MKRDPDSVRLGKIMLQQAAALRRQAAQLETAALAVTTTRDVAQVHAAAMRTLAPGEVTPEAVRAARGMLGWTQAQLAREAGVGTSTVADMERGARRTEPGIQNRIHTALEGGGAAIVRAVVAGREVTAVIWVGARPEVRP